MKSLKKDIKTLDDFFESPKGHILIGTIVMINALILGAQTFKNIPLKLELFLHHLDKAILWVFVVELSVRLLAGKLMFFKRGWNIFDTIVVLGAFLHHLDFLPILRAFRCLHLMSLIETSPRTRHIISGLWKAIPGVVNVFFIFILFFYIFCVLGVFLFRDLGMAEFQDIGISMKTMFQVLTGDNWSDIMRSSEKGNPYSWAYFILFHIVVAFIVLNLVIGVIVGALQSAEQEIFSQDTGDDRTKELALLIHGQLKTLEQKVDHLMTQRSSFVSSGRKALDPSKKP